MKKDLLKKIRKLFTVAQSIKREHVMAVPYRDWRFVVIFFIAGFVVSVGLNTYVFMRINEDIFVASVSTEDIAELDRGQIALVLEYFDKKDVAFEELKSKPLTAVDPSL